MRACFKFKISRAAGTVDCRQPTALARSADFRRRVVCLALSLSRVCPVAAGCVTEGGSRLPTVTGLRLRPASLSADRGAKKFLKTLFFLILTTGSLLAQENEDIRGPKPLIDIPKVAQPDHTLWFILAGLLFVAILGWFLWRRFAGKHKPQTSSEIALTSLSELGSGGEDLPAAEFAERAALSVRRYIAGAFGIAAPNRTTEEFFRELPASSVKDEEGHLHAFLKSCDLAKFAAADLDAGRRAKLIESAKGFVISTSAEGGKP